jgi:plastocyanin
MRYFGFTALVTSAIVLGACGKGEQQQQSADNTAANPASSATTPSATPAANAVPAAPVTGTTHEVKMIGDAQGYRFDPVTITIKQGDGIKYINASGGPHNVAIDPASLPAAAKAQLTANMNTTNTTGELSGTMLVNPNDSYTISFGKVPPGTYVVHCTPHLAMNMKQTVTVTP